MSLIRCKIKGLAGKAISMFKQPKNQAVVMYKSADGKNGSTGFIVPSNGFLNVFVEAGDYITRINGAMSESTVSVSEKKDKVVK